MAALRPVEILTKKLCEANFNVIKAQVLFQSCFRALGALNSTVGDRLLESLRQRYDERRNGGLLSVLKFLTDPVAYTPGEGNLEMSELRKEIRQVYVRLFPMDAEVAAVGEEQEPETAAVDADAASAHLKELPYHEQLAKQFEADLNRLGAASQSTPRLLHIGEEIALAAKTGELTNKLSLVHRALLSIPAASIESERAFSVAAGFATKIRSRLSDTTLDNFAFAKFKFKANDRKVVKSFILVFVSVLSHASIFFHLPDPYSECRPRSRY